MNILSFPATLSEFFRNYYSPGELRCKYTDGNQININIKVNILKLIINKYNLQNKCTLLAPVVFGTLEPLTLVNWILEDKLDVRFQLQIHKFIWHPETKGV